MRQQSMVVPDRDDPKKIGGSAIESESLRASDGATIQTMRFWAMAMDQVFS